MAAIETIPATADPMMPQPYVVQRVDKDTPDTFSLLLEPENGVNGASFQPGQFSMLWVFGVGELPISISGDPSQHARLAYTVRSVGKATNALVSRKVGDQIGVRGPFGTGWPIEAARGRDVIIVAGGIGLAPLRPVIYEVLGNRHRYGRLVLLYGARSPSDVLYRKELVAWARQPETQVLTTVDYGGLSWRGHVGVVTTLFKYARLQPSRSVAMICGPEIMMRFVTRELELQGLKRDDIYVSMERNMKCGVGFCGHCQYGPHFICKDGPVFPFEQIRQLLDKYEL
ncbi:MAG TPA: FAD/NAD(P)-binding protein [Candidatus Sulfotelmatobacter sp.]|nr:FAD/NAD(P)-binding protein [Candidatus Sulfotelmatobacter sp.]